MDTSNIRTKSNRTCILRELPKRFAKDWMRLHELSPLSKGQSICVFQKKSNQNQNHKIGKKRHEHCTTFRYIALFHMKSAFTIFLVDVGGSLRLQLRHSPKKPQLRHS